MRMASTITNMSAVPLPHPTHGRFHIQNVTRMAGFAPSTLGDLSLEFHFNPLIDLSSPATARSFLAPILAVNYYDVGAEIVDRIAAFAFDQAHSRNWLYGLSLSVVLETIHVAEEPRAATAVRDYYEALDDFFPNMMVQPFGSTGVDPGNDSTTLGMSEGEISLLPTQQFSGDEDGECCCICLEEFVAGAVITPLSSCSHSFHHACIVEWLRNKPTCPICRSRCLVTVS